MNPMNRRTFLTSTGSAALLLASTSTGSAFTGRQSKMGISVASYGARWRDGDVGSGLARFENAIDFLRHAHKLGAGGIQTGVRGWSKGFAIPLRDYAETHGLFLEGQIRMPRDLSELEVFEQELAIGKEAGMDLFRTVMLSGRRYETFKDLKAWQEFGVQSKRSLAWVRPILEKHKVRLAVENHKDWRVEEMWDLFDSAKSPQIGINLDMGNSISLLEDPWKVIEAYAPLTITTHFKDMAVLEYEDGFLLSEVPLGEGFIDLKKAVAILNKANPDIRHNLEMITRDPLKVPCLKSDYWVTFGKVTGQELAHTLSMVRQRQSVDPLPHVSGLTISERVRFEEANVVASFRHARQLGMS